MSRNKGQQIREAADLLGLGEKASLSEIKRAYRRLSKKYHPDMAEEPAGEDSVEMHHLTEAYQLLLKYCSEYRFPLDPGEDVQLEGEDWWFQRFGQDHHWGKGAVPGEENDK